jgi:hypothetical protein
MENKVLIGIPVKNCGAWLEATVRQIINLDYYKENLSIVFVENDSEDYSYQVVDYCVNKLLSKYNYRSVCFEKKDMGFSLPHESRHDFRHMKNRMNSLKIIRNHIIDVYLKDNDYLWWVDADYRKIPYDILKVAMSHNKDILMPRVEINGKNYDGMTCGIYENTRYNIQELSKLVTDRDIYPMEIVECASIISRRVFDAGLRYDSGVALLNDGSSKFLQEGPYFSNAAKQKGFELYGLLTRVIEHQEICGTIPFDI